MQRGFFLIQYNKGFFSVSIQTPAEMASAHGKHDAAKEIAQYVKVSELEYEPFVLVFLAHFPDVSEYSYLLSY